MHYGKVYEVCIAEASLSHAECLVHILVRMTHWVETHKDLIEQANLNKRFDVFEQEPNQTNEMSDKGGTLLGIWQRNRLKRRPACIKLQTHFPKTEKS